MSSPTPKPIDNVEGEQRSANIAKYVHCERETQLVENEMSPCFGQVQRWNARAALLTLSISLSGCAQFGQAELKHDQVEYSQTLSESAKDQVLLNIVRLRYGETPVFLNTTQVIAGYQLQQNLSAGGEAFLKNPMGSFLTGSGDVQVQQSPTFTFEPVRGQAFAQSYLRKLPLETVFSIVDDGLPIDLVLRLTVASINDYQNSDALASNESAETKTFLHLLADLRKLQLRGLLDIKQIVSQAPSRTADGKTNMPLTPPALVLLIREGHDPASISVAHEVRRLLGLAADQGEAEIVPGRRPDRRGQVAIDTRAILGIMGAVGFGVDVPPGDVEQGLTVSTIETAGVRPPIRILSSAQRPINTFAAGQYHGKWFYIEDNDFSSKLAFSVLQLTTSLTENAKGTGAIVTVPAR